MFRQELEETVGSARRAHISRRVFETCPVPKLRGIERLCESLSSKQQEMLGRLEELCTCRQHGVIVFSHTQVELYDCMTVYQVEYCVLSRSETFEASETPRQRKRAKALTVLLVHARRELTRCANQTMNEVIISNRQHR